jgi:DNA-binding transcriptional LysR family regulator
MIKLQHVEMLLAIENAGSLRAAAKTLNRTQPALTKALRQAEAELGAAIFQRAPSGVVATVAGKPILRRARIIQAELRKMQEEVDQLKGAAKGALNITVSPLAAIRIIPEAVRRFRRRFPSVNLQFNGSHEPMAFGPLRDGAVDIVVGPAPRGKTEHGLSLAPLLITPIVVITGKGSRWASAKSLRDLVQADWLHIGPRERRPLFRQTFTKLGLLPPEPVVNSESITSILSMVEDSDFLCTFPLLLLEDIASKWHIQPVPIAEELPTASIAATYSADRPLTPAGQHFLDCVCNVAATMVREAKGYAQKLSQ